MEEISVVIPEDAANIKLPDPDLYYFWALEKNRIFYLDSEIDECVLNLQKMIIDFNILDKDIPVEERTPIKIFIDSPGGFLQESMSIAETICMSKTPVYTVDIANAYSGAALIFLAGHKRFIMKFADVLLHSGSASQDGNYEAIQETNKNYKKIVDKMWKYVQDHTNLDDKMIKKNKTREWYITSEEAIKYGIADKVLESLEEVM